MPGGEAAPSSGDVQGQFDGLLSLVLARSRGEVGNDDVESALSSIVAQHAPAAPAGCAARRKKQEIVPDEGNYDDDSEDDAPPKASPPKKVAATATKKANGKGDAAARKLSKKEHAARQASIEEIPLGRMGEKMLVTFGDGPIPNVDVISAALLGTRTCLQRAILDARALRRHEKGNWDQARTVATMYRTSAPKMDMGKAAKMIQTSVVGSELSFRAMDGFGDSLRSKVLCGFDVPQLKTLFPEEMGAFQRWKEMHEAYTDKSGEDANKTPEEYDEAERASQQTEAMAMAPEQETVHSGRLVGRLANFDARTNRMGGDWYLTFANVRRGSFLPRRTGPGRKKKMEANYQQEMQFKRGRGRPVRSRTSWNSLHPTSVIFLHWIGFDPKSALSPPNEETTQALGFLAYDFFGKIVEKAVSLRLDRDTSKHAKQDRSRSDSPLLELTGGDQIEKENIDQALAEADLSSLYSSSNIDLGKSAKIAQLYFGPGFEDRLELEMEEIFGSKEKALSLEEMKTRQDEEHLFSELPQVPTLLDNVTGVLDDDQKEEEAKKQPAASSKKRRRSK